MLLGGFELVNRASPKRADATRASIERIVRFYERTHRTADAATWRARMSATPS
jgi:hypothetical protein